MRLTEKIYTTMTDGL